MRPDIPKLVVAAVAAFVATACAGVSVRLTRPVSVNVLFNMSDVYADVVQMIDITYLPTLSLLLTALHYVVSGTMHYAARARFLEWTVSVPVMMLGIASLSGVTDASVLAFVAICSMASMLLGLVHEGSRNTASQTTAGTHTQASDSVFHRLEDYVLFFVSALLMIMVWASIGAQLSRSKPPSFVYAIVVLECIGFALFPVIHVRNMTLAQRETMHMYVGLVVKSILCIVQTAGTRSIATDAGGA